MNTLATKRHDPDYLQLSGYIPKGLGLRFKSVCTLKEISISEALEDAVTRWLKEEESGTADTKSKHSRKQSEEQ